MKPKDELLRRQRRDVVVKPGFIDFGVGAVGDDFLQTGVDFRLQFSVAFGHRDTEILAFKPASGTSLNCFSGCCLM